MTLPGERHGEPRVSPSVRRAYAVLALSPLATAAGFLSGASWLLPVVSAAPAYASMIVLLRRGMRGRAVAAMIVWALLLGASMTALCYAMPGRAAGVVIHGPAYWDEMRIWLETGEGRESRPADFLPQHALHAAAFVALALVSAALLALLFGTVLMGYMAYYVAAVMRATPAHPLLAGVLGWHPWSVVRVVSFIALGVLLAEPLLGRIFDAARVRPRPRPLEARRLGLWPSANGTGDGPSGPPVAGLLMAGGGLVLDIVLKTILAPHWPALLRALR